MAQRESSRADEFPRRNCSGPAPARVTACRSRWLACRRERRRRHKLARKRSPLGAPRTVRPGATSTRHTRPPRREARGRRDERRARPHASSPRRVVGPTTPTASAGMMIDGCSRPYVNGPVDVADSRTGTLTPRCCVHADWSRRLHDSPRAGVSARETNEAEQRSQSPERDRGVGQVNRSQHRGRSIGASGGGERGTRVDWC